jgi:hypothetical protein
MYPNQGFWDRIAKSYANSPINNQQAINAMLGNICKHVKESDTVLDFGC